MQKQAAGVQSGFTHPPRNRRIGIIGAGPGGISIAHQLKTAGYDNFVMWERGSDVGGTWFHNRYPGLQCDVASHLYSFSFDLNPAWSRAFATQPEILEYIKGVVDRQDIRRHVKLNTAVESAAWDDECAKWRVQLANGAEEVVDILCSAQGMFNGLRWPDIEGLDSFAGEAMHSGAWRDEVSLEGKKVAVIGTAATTVQMLPVIAKQAARIDVYQRTPVWVLPKDDPVFSEETIAARSAEPSLVQAERQRLYNELDAFVDWPKRTDVSDMRALCEQNLMAVADPETRAKLTPTFNWGCARPLLSNDFYPVFNRDNVHLITDAIVRVVPEGIVDETGTVHPCDVIICATGYHVDRFLSAIDVRGVGGIDIKDAWSDGAKAYLGITTAGFPNLFMSYGPNTNNGSLIAMGEYEASYIVRHIEWMDANNVDWIDIKPEAEDRYNQELQEQIRQVAPWHGACHNYYFNATGRIITQYPFNMTVYQDVIAKPDLDNYRIQYARANPAA